MDATLQQLVSLHYRKALRELHERYVKPEAETMATKLEETQHHVEDVLAELETWFTPDMLLTLVVRHPKNPDRHLVFTRDDLQKVSAMLMGMNKKK